VVCLRDVNTQMGNTSAQFANELAGSWEWATWHLPTRIFRVKSLLSLQPLAFVPSTEGVPVALMGRKTEEKPFLEHEWDKG